MHICAFAACIPNIRLVDAILPSPREDPTLLHVNNTGGDQPFRSPISALVVRSLARKIVSAYYMKSFHNPADH